MLELKSGAKTFTLKVMFNGVEHIAQADPEKSILENIEAMCLPIRYACRRGRCGSCKVQLANGTLHPQRQILDNGYVLSCSSLLVSDAQVVISY